MNICCIAHGTLFNVMCQPGWEVGFGGEWMHVYVWLSPITVHLKLSIYCQLAMPQYKMFLVLLKKRYHQESEKAIQQIILVIYKEPYNSEKTQIAQLKNGQKTWTDISIKKINKWPISTLQDIQNYQSSGNCKSKDTTSKLPGWLESKRKIITNVGEKLKPLDTACENVKWCSNFSEQYGSFSHG